MACQKASGESQILDQREGIFMIHRSAWQPGFLGNFLSVWTQTMVAEVMPLEPHGTAMRMVMTFFSLRLERVDLQTFAGSVFRWAYAVHGIASLGGFGGLPVWQTLPALNMHLHDAERQKIWHGIDFEQLER